MHEAIGFNNRQQLTSSTFTNVHRGSNSNATIANSYEYFDDGRNSHITSGIDNKFDRAYTYDHMGRLHEALTGAEARGGTTADGPYKQTYSYDVWTNTTGLTSRFWTQDNSSGGNYTNNRRQYWSYDAGGNATDASNDNYSYDVTGKPTYYGAGWVGDDRALEVTTSYDGSGASVKQIQRAAVGIYDENNELQISFDESGSYYLRSTALGGKVIAEIAPQGHITDHVYAGGVELAQTLISGSTTNVGWQHTDPLTGSSFVTDTDRTFGGQKEIGTLGEVVTTPPPPAPTMPSFLQPILPVEYTGGPSNEFGIPNWYVNMAMASWDANQASNMHSIGRDDLAQDILAKNPNVGIVVTGYGKAFLDFLSKTNFEFVFFGGNAAAALSMVPKDYGEVVGYAVGDPQNTRTYDPCTAVNAEMDSSGDGYYTYEDSGWLKYGQPNVVAVFQQFASDWNITHPNNSIGVGDLSQFGGAGNFARHPAGGHPGGVIIDMRPMRNDNVQGPTNFNSGTYSRDITTQLIQGLSALADVVSIRFNDPNITDPKLVRDRDRFETKSGSGLRSCDSSPVIRVGEALIA